VSFAELHKINREDGNYTQIPGDYENPDGLAWQNGFLWVGLRDQKKLAKINPNTGQIILTLDLEGMPDGLTFDGSYLWYGEHINTGGTMNKIDPVSGEQLIQVDISNFADDVVGLTWDGMYFWISDDQKNKIFKIFYGDGTSSTDGCSQKELDAQFEAGKQYCIDNPESCGITTNDDPTCAQVITYGKVPSADCWVEFPTPCDVPTDWETANEKPEFMCGESSGDDRYDEGFQAGIATCDNPTPVADSNCATFDLFTNTLSVPCLDMGKIYWVDMQLVEDHLTISGFGEVE
jgi:hypothetical protein